MNKTVYYSIFLLLWALPVGAQDWQHPQMAWGEPDLQGTWTNATITLLERPDEFPNLVLTEDEARAMEGVTAQMFVENDNVSEGDLVAGENVGGYNSFWMDPGTRAARVNGEPRSSIVVEPEDGQIPYNLWSKIRKYWELYTTVFRKSDNPEEQALGVRCMVGFGSSGGPPMLPVLYNNNYQIVQSPGVVMILVEMNHNVRTIRIDGEPLPPQIRPWLGDSIGHWEGNTLVVETSQFHMQQSLRAAIKHQVLMTPDSKVVERFTRLGEREVLYEFSVEDDEIYSDIWRGQMPMYAAEGQIYEYACHEGNYSMPGILAGARREENE
ncbi:MAG: hypothetical protein HOC23_00385 [Halieaceae bacterium]|nr:hypothetical protein [Halieaceae bacterium]